MLGQLARRYTFIYPSPLTYIAINILGNCITYKYVIYISLEKYFTELLLVHIAEMMETFQVKNLCIYAGASTYVIVFIAFKYGLTFYLCKMVGNENTPH